MNIPATIYIKVVIPAKAGIQMGERKNGCLLPVKRFINIPPYLKWDRRVDIP
jgi:hypothetical protein